MNKKIRIGNKGGVVTLTDKNYLTAGGEASIYVNGGKAFKIYHDPKKVISESKLKELTLITNPQVIAPQDLIYDNTNGDLLGYTSDFINNTEPLLKYFTKTFKQNNQISHAMICELVKQLQLVTNDIHLAKCLIVDFNELNILVGNSNSSLRPYFIDVDSYATPTHKGMAIMDSVRDRRVSTTKNGYLSYNPDVQSDWFSWAILTFWLYTNIHPYRGSHPNYKPKDKVKQMDDGVSVFHKDVRVPPTVNDFQSIPPRHLEYFKSVFLRNERGIPPLPDSLVPMAVPRAVVTIQGTNQIDVFQDASYGEDIQSVTQLNGLNYVVTKTKVFVNDKELRADVNKYKKVFICQATDGTPIMAALSNNLVFFINLSKNVVIGTVSSNNMFKRNNAIYTIANGKLSENLFSSIIGNVVQRITEIENVSQYSTKMYDGCVIQELLGKFYLTVPYKINTCFSTCLTELDGYRIVDCKCERNMVVIIGEKKGKYDRFVIIFKKDYLSYDVRKVEDIAYDTINFTVMENGLCLLLNNTNELELFSNNQSITVLNDPPFDASMPMYNTSVGVYFINGNSLHRIKRK